MSEQLVREGTAIVQCSHGENRYKDKLLAAQKEARAKRAGIWAALSVSGEPSYTGDSRQPVFHRPSCGQCAKINAERVKTVENNDEAFDAGYAPCRHCTS